MKTNRINLNADALYSTVKSVFDKIPEYRKNEGNIKSSLADGLMSGLAIFAMKFPSLLKFDEARKDSVKNKNLKSLFSVGHIPSDTQMRGKSSGYHAISGRPLRNRCLFFFQFGILIGSGRFFVFALFFFLVLG